MKYSKLNEEQAALLFEERKKQILGSLIQQYSKTKKQQTNKNDISTIKETQLKKIVKSTLLKDIGCIDREIQKMTKENINEHNSRNHCQTKSINQTELSRSENVINRHQSYFTNRQKINKINSLVENSYSKLAESIRNYSNQKKEEPKNQDKAYDFLQIKSQSEKKMQKEKQKSVSIQKAPGKIISSERKIPKPPLKQLSSQRMSESEKTSPVKSILKNSNHDHTIKANTTQLFYQNKIGDYKLQEALNIYKSLKQIMDSSAEKSTYSLLNKKATNFMSHKGLKQPL